MERLTDNQIIRYIVKWVLAEMLGFVLLITGYKFGNFFWSVPGIVLMCVSVFGIGANTIVLVKRAIKGEKVN